MSEYSLGIDIGGTFTDLVIHDHNSGRRWGSKVLTTHADPQQGVVVGVRTILAESGLDPRSIGRVVHATTLFTNALIERKGAPTGLLVTDGFRDMLEIGRERKYDLYDIGIENPAPLVPRNLRLGVSERMRADGRVADPLDEAQLLRQVDVLKLHGFDEEDIWDIAGIAAFFALSNRMANVTAMRPNAQFYTMGRS